MSNLETPIELANFIADLCGVYGGGLDSGEHPDDCECRSCFVVRMARRIREACANEVLIARGSVQ